MIFNSWQFLLFMIIIFIGYWSLLPQYQFLFLTIGSFLFYASYDIRYLFYLLFFILLTYIFSLIINKLSGIKQKIFLGMIIFLGISLLVFFKYMKFLNDILYRTIGINNNLFINIIGPIGFSFYLFQAIGYLVDIYKGKCKVEKNLIRYALFISFFPHVISGPISRGNFLLYQFDKNIFFNYEDAVYGIKRFFIGLFKKIVLSNTLGMTINNVYEDIYKFKGFSLMLVSIFYMIQIYCDFSGYSDMAIGSAKLLGINLPENFNLPYFSKSIHEFWQRWHISLSLWFRDYLYIPLGGNKKNKIQKWINVFLTFLVSGLWHGANYTFIVWGVLHGVLQVLEDIFAKKICINFWFINILKHIYVLVLLFVTWIFFRAQSISDAFYILINMFSEINNPIEYLKMGIINLKIDEISLVTIIVSVLLLVIIDSISYIYGDVIKVIDKLSILSRWCIYIIFIIIIIVFTPTAASTEFIYFQF